MRTISLFLDESGSANPKVIQSRFYILCGCVCNENARANLKIHFDQIKFKYWGRTNIVFHSREIGRAEGEFSILSDPKIRKSFEQDLIAALSKGAYNLFAVAIDKPEALKKNWNELKVIEVTAHSVIRNFIFMLISRNECKGRLVAESATSAKDFVYHKVLGQYLSRGIPKKGISYVDVQDKITEISFVTKKNLDIEEQIADLMAYAIRLKAEKRAKSSMNAYEKNLLKVLNKKLYQMHPNTNTNRKPHLSEIKGFEIL